MNSTRQALFTVGYNARVQGAQKCPGRRHATLDGYRCANSLFSKETCLIIQEQRLPCYPKPITVDDIDVKLAEAEAWYDTCLELLARTH